jgi:hypothetical protein
MYAMISTRPDVSFALSATSRHQSEPGKEHWVVVKRILKYLRRTKGLFLVYGGDWCLVDEGASSSSSIPGNGARKQLDGAGRYIDHRPVGNPKRKV